MKHVTFLELAGVLQAELENRVLPFWLRHAVDDEQGGLLTCLTEDGRVVSTEKYLWSQTRALWVYATLAGRQPDPAFRKLADSLYDFCARHGRNARGEWLFRVDRSGRMLQDADSIYTDGFALMGLAAYHTLTRSAESARLLRETADSVRARLARPGSYRTLPYELPAGANVHAVSMLFSLAFWEAYRALGDEALRQSSVELADDVLHHFVSERDQAVLEFLDLQNRPLAGAIGRCCVPGHAIESMWALIRIFRATGRKADVARCVEILRWHMDKGWDREFGGLYLGIDLDGGDPYWPYADYKAWWPAVEAMHALLLAYRESRARWCLEWYERVHNYAFSHFPVPGGEWRNRLDRRGRPVHEVIALPVKDPFHLPRALIHCQEILPDLADDPATVTLETH